MPFYIKCHLTTKRALLFASFWHCEYCSLEWFRFTALFFTQNFSCGLIMSKFLTFEHHSGYANISSKNFTIFRAYFLEFTRKFINFFCGKSLISSISCFVQNVLNFNYFSFLNFEEKNNLIENWGNVLPISLVYHQVWLIMLIFQYNKTFDCKRKKNSLNLFAINISKNIVCK